MKKTFLSPFFCLLFFVGVLLFCHLTFPAQEKKEIAGQKETTVRNLTKETISYSILRLSGDSPPVRRSIKPDGLDRWPCDGPLDLMFKRRNETVDYTLECGLSYAFRYSDNDAIELYSGSHGLFGVADLAPFVPTPMSVVEKMLDLAQVDKDDVLFDLGCGDGRIVIAAAKKYGTRGVGIDIDPKRIEESMRAAKAAGVENLVEFRVQDVMRADFSRATVVTLYLLPESNELLRPLLDDQLKPGAYVVSHNYSIPGWEKKEVACLTVKDAAGEEHSIYVYRR